MDQIRQELYSLLGDLPDRDRPISARVVERRKTHSYRLEKLVLDLNGIEARRHKLSVLPICVTMTT